jgi:hypothetical protein
MDHTEFSQILLFPLYIHLNIKMERNRRAMDDTIYTTINISLKQSSKLALARSPWQVNIKFGRLKNPILLACLASKISDREIHYSGVQPRTFCHVTTVSWLTSVSHVKRVIYWEPTLFMFRFPLSSIIS